MQFFRIHNKSSFGSPIKKSVHLKRAFNFIIMSLFIRDFTQKAVKDIERFQEQKTADLKETLAGYSILQLKTAKKV